MALHKDFPKDKFQILAPAIRWFPADEDLRKEGYEKLLPPFVPELRERVAEWRKNNYEGASETSKALLNWWFKEPHTIFAKDGTSVAFQYYYAQREAVETIIWIYDVEKVANKYDLIKFDKLGRVSPNMFTEDWLRFVIKMATGSGKTKVMSLLLAWSYFHKLYEENSELAKNFLLITPNIIVLDRIKADFEGLKIFYEDPILPDNGYQGQNWQDDFQIKLHLQDEVGTISKSGNIFLTNIHRVYGGSLNETSFEDEDASDYFLGNKVVGKTNDSKIDLSEIVRDVDELMVINDEAHHIHDPKMAWFKSIEDIHNRLLQKGKKIALQIDVTATPKNNRGEIFVQTVSDYPLVEAIHQGVVKNPVLPDQASRAKLQEKQSSIFSEKYEDYIRLGVEEWQKTYKELQDLRKKANEIDSAESPYKVIVSVLMLKEGWDVKNVTTIVGLRPYSAKSNILPEQTLGRGLRRMYWGEDIPEYLSVVGTDAFMDFVESIRSEGVELEFRKMGEGTAPKAPLVIEVDKENVHKDIEKLD